MSENGRILVPEGLVRERTLQLARMNRSLLADIVERRQAEEALQGSERALRALVDANPESVSLIDSSGTVLVANETGARRLGRGMAELVGSCLYDHLAPAAAATRRQRVREAADTGQSVGFESTDDGRFTDSYVVPATRLAWGWRSASWPSRPRAGTSASVARSARAAPSGSTCQVPTDTLARPADGHARGPRTPMPPPTPGVIAPGTPRHAEPPPSAPIPVRRPP